MKKFIYKKIIATFLLIVFFAISCKDDFLDVRPTASFTDTQLPSKKGLEGTLIGVYSMLTGRGQDFYAGSTNWFWGSILGGEANKGTNAGDQAQMNEVQIYKAQPTNNSIRSKYATTYEGIARANALFRLLANAEPTVTDDLKTRIEAEGKFLRGHYYFELKKLFNNTPYIDESVDYAKGIEKIGNDKDLWPMIEADLKFAYENLPETQSAPGRANKWAAGAYLGKAYLFQKKFAEAKGVFDQVIANGKTANGKKYGLVAKYGDLWRIANDNNEESVFAIQAAAGTGTVNNANPDFVLNFPYNGGPAGCCGFFQPSFELANSFRTDGNGLPLLDGSHNTGTNQLITDQGVGASSDWKAEDKYLKDQLVTAVAAPNTVRVYKSLVGAKDSENIGNDPLSSPSQWEKIWEEDIGTVDPRLDYSVGRRGIPYLDHGRHVGFGWIRDQDYGGPYAPKKFIWSKAEEASAGVDKSSWTPGYAAINVPIIRFADVLLMAAEAEIEAGDPMKARDYVNLVRTRAANAAGYVMDGANPAANYAIANYNDTWLKDDATRNKVRFERKLELSGEGHRFFDLVRWGIADATLDAYLAYESSKVSASPFKGETFTANKAEYLPIPQSEIDILGTQVLKQNPGY